MFVNFLFWLADANFFTVKNINNLLSFDFLCSMCDILEYVLLLMASCLYFNTENVLK